MSFVLEQQATKCAIVRRFAATQIFCLTNG